MIEFGFEVVCIRMSEDFVSELSQAVDGICMR